MDAGRGCDLTPRYCSFGRLRRCPSPCRSSAGDEGAKAGFAGLGLAAIAIALFALAAFSPAVLGDGDTFSHLATGEWIIAHRAAPHVDPFGLSMAGAPWIAHEWLSEVVLTLAFRVGGWSAVVLLTGAAVAAAALIVGLSAARELRAAPLVVTVGVGLGLMTASLLARPHMLALPIAAVDRLLNARDRGRAPPLVLVVLMTAWANMHGGFIFGLLLIGPFALEAFADAQAGARLATACAWTLFGLAALAAALVNPYGVEALILPFRLIGTENLSRISEWRPQDFSHPGTMELALLMLIGLTLTRPFAMAPMRAALIVALVAMALQHSRHQALLAILAPMLLARPIAAAVGGRPYRRGSAGGWLRPALTATIERRRSRSGPARLSAPIGRVDGSSAPISALEAVPADLRGKPVLNDYGFGGYLIFSHVRPFIDARAELYGDPMLSLYSKLQAGNSAAIENTLERYAIAWTIFPPDARIVAILDRTPGWRRLHSDATAVVQAREDAPHPERA